MYSRKQGSHARGVYLTQDTSHMETVRVKQEEEADTRIVVNNTMKYGKKERGHYKGEKVPNKA